MNAYSCHAKDAQGEGAMLVFAPTGQRARVISYGLDWCECDFIDWVARKLHNLPTHLALLDDGSEQVVSAPPVCPECHYWGYELIDDGKSGCKGCSEVSK